MRVTDWKVGDLARRTGVSIRTLHYYDQIGLLAASQRSEAGYRLYTTADIARLQQIRSLRQLGFSLRQIRHLIEHRESSPRQVLALHLRQLRERIALEQALCTRLETLIDRLSSAEQTCAEDFLYTLEMMNMVDNVERHYTPEQLAALQERAKQVGPERMREVEAAWPELIAEVRAELDRGTDPLDERVLSLARRWQSLVREFTGNDPGIMASLQTMYAEDPEVRRRNGIDSSLFAYIGPALKAVGG